MAIDARLVGDFELTPELEAKVRSSIRDAEEFEPKPERTEFKFYNRLVSVAGFYRTNEALEDVAGTEIPVTTVLFYHVLDKDRAGAALAEIVASVIECLPAIPGDIALNYPDFAALARVADKLTVYRRSMGDDFWDYHNYMELVPPPYEVAVYPLPQPDEDDLEQDEDDF